MATTKSDTKSTTKSDTKSDTTSRDITETLTRQHDEMRGLIGRMASDIAPGAKIGILHGLRNMWTWHGDAEEETLYARMRAKGKATSEVTEGKAEHDQGEVLFAAMADIDTASHDFIARFEALAEVVEHHLDEEEEELFVEAREELSADESAELAERFTNRYRTFELQHRTVDQLRADAQNMGVEGSSKLNKDDLISAIQGTIATRSRS